MDQVILQEKGGSGGDDPKRSVVPPKLPLEQPQRGTEIAPHNVRRLVFALTEGDVVLTVPADMSADSVEDLEGYLEVFMRKARRQAGLQTKKPD